MLPKTGLIQFHQKYQHDQFSSYFLPNHDPERLENDLISVLSVMSTEKNTAHENVLVVERLDKVLELVEFMLKHNYVLERAEDVKEPMFIYTILWVENTESKIAAHLELYVARDNGQRRVICFDQDGFIVSDKTMMMKETDPRTARVHCEIHGDEPLDEVAAKVRNLGRCRRANIDYKQLREMKRRMTESLKAVSDSPEITELQRILLIADPRERLDAFMNYMGLSRMAQVIITDIARQIATPDVPKVTRLAKAPQWERFLTHVLTPNEHSDDAKTYTLLAGSNRPTHSIQEDAAFWKRICDVQFPNNEEEDEL